MQQFGTRASLDDEQDSKRQRAYLALRDSGEETFLDAYRRLGDGPFKAALYPAEAARDAA